MNNLYLNVARGGRVKAPAYRQWERKADAHRPASIEQLQGELCAVYRMGRPSRRRMDLANREKAATDLLVRWGVMADDCQVVDLRMVWDASVPPGVAVAEISERA